MREFEIRGSRARRRPGHQRHDDWNPQTRNAVDASLRHSSPGIRRSLHARWLGEHPAGRGAVTKSAPSPGWYRSVADLAPSSRIPAVTEEALSIVSERRGSTHYVVPSGELDIATVQLLEGALLSVEQTDVEMIVLDLSSLAFIDSNGLRLVLDANDRCSGTADRLRVIAGSPAVERLLDIVGLRERLPLIAP